MSIVVITIVHVVFAIVIPIPVSHDPFLPFRNVSSRGPSRVAKHRPYHSCREARNGCVHDLRSVSWTANRGWRKDVRRYIWRWPDGTGRGPSSLSASCFSILRTDEGA
jgi:hypothetical protein